MIKRNFLSILVALIIAYLSLASASAFENVPAFNIPFLDKLVHIAMYFGLMSTVIFENRKSIKNNQQLFLIGLIPLFYGILIEIIQATATVSRTGDLFDALADLAGIIISILLWLTIKPLFNRFVRW